VEMKQIGNDYVRLCFGGCILCFGPEGIEVFGMVEAVVVDVDGGDWRDGDKSVSHNGWGWWWDIQ